MNKTNKDHASELLAGSYEMHVHTAPSHYPRLLDDWEYAACLDQYRMAGSVIKKHLGGTADRAALVNAHGGFKAKLFGTLVLNRNVGGLNPAAVEAELQMGACLIYLPTQSAENHILNKQETGKKQPVPVLDASGRILPELYEIMNLIKAYDAVLCTGHVSAAEADLIIRNGLDYGCRMMLTHPEILFIQMPAEAQKELAQKGAYIEKCWLNVFTGQSARTKCAGTSYISAPSDVFSQRILARQIIPCLWKEHCHLSACSWNMGLRMNRYEG